MGTVTALLQAGADNLCIRCRYLGRGLPWNTVTDRCASCSLRSIEPGMRHRSAADFFARAFSYRQTSPVARQGSRVDLAASGMPVDLLLKLRFQLRIDNWSDSVTDSFALLLFTVHRTVQLQSPDL